LSGGETARPFDGSKTWHEPAEEAVAGRQPSTRLQASLPKPLSPYTVRINGKDQSKIRRDQTQAQ
jgi:hypothetical protein